MIGTVEYAPFAAAGHRFTQENGHMIIDYSSRGGFILGAVLAGAWPFCGAHAETLEECLLSAVQSASASTTVGELRTMCEVLQASPPEAPVAATEHAAAVAAHADGAVEKRLALERYSHDNPFVLTPHRPNYLLPVVYTTHRDSSSFPGEDADLQRTEVQFQLSLKVLVLENMFGDNGHLSVAYTNHSFWQAYNRDISAAFRDTNHEPEVLFTLENDWHLFGMRNSANQFILNHQSNGRGSELSRSWNRVMINSIWEKDSFVFSFKPWYRIPEDKKDSPAGNFEWLGLYQSNSGQILSLLVRNNLRADNRGAMELSYSFPLGHTRLKGYLKYFNGYGESLIDYNHRTQSFGVGFLISDWL
jgi:phospholipase A1